MKVQITDLLTQEKTLYVNDLSLEENIISTIISANKQNGQLLNRELRSRLKSDFPVVTSVSTKTGQPFAYCESKNLHAKFI